MPGVSWPTDSDGRVRTTAVGKSIWVACLEAMRGCVPGDRLDALIRNIEGEQRWRFKYTEHLGEMASLMAENQEAAYAQADRGLAALYETFRFERNGVSLPLREAVAGQHASLAVSGVDAETIVGDREVAEQLAVPIEVAGVTDLLVGERLEEQALAWAEYGCCEASVAASIATVAKMGRNRWPISNHIYVLLGATSALCPAKPLLSLGATVVAVARRGEKLDALRSFARRSAGTLVCPTVSGQTRPGLDILTEAPELCQWLEQLADAHRDCRVVIGSYIYLDGERHVRASMAMDAVCERLEGALGPARVALAYLASPATAHLYPETALEDATERWRTRPWWARVGVGFKPTSGASLRSPSSHRIVFNGYVSVQGPNYALAKTLQLWRAVVARRNGVVVAANFAPPGRTLSMLHSDVMAAALDGMQAFRPLVVLQQDTCAAFMTVLLLHDLVEPACAANPGTTLEHPWDQFTHNAFHGGGWRCAFTSDSIGFASYVLGKLHYMPGTAGLAPSDRNAKL